MSRWQAIAILLLIIFPILAVLDLGKWAWRKWVRRAVDNPWPWTLTVAIAVVAVVGLGVLVTIVRPSRPFTSADLDRYAQAVADLDSEIEFQKIIKPQETRMNLIALTLNGQPTEPLEIWRNLRPLLEERWLDPADVQQARNHVRHLMVLAMMFEHEASKREFESLQKEVIAWEYR